MQVKHLTLCLLGLGLAGLAHAAKPPIYDDFSSTDGLDRVKWFESEGDTLGRKDKVLHPGPGTVRRHGQRQWLGDRELLRQHA